MRAAFQVVLNRMSEHRLASGILVLAAVTLCGCASVRTAPAPASSSADQSGPAMIAEIPLAHAMPTSARVVRNDDGALTVDFATSAAYPNLRLVLGAPWNWESDGGTTLVMDVTNASAAPVPIGLRVDDGVLPNGDFIAASTLVPVGDHRVMLRLANVSPNEPYVLPAMTTEPQVPPGVVVLHPRVGTEFDLSHVTAVTVYLARPTTETTLTIRHFARVAETPARGFAFAD